MSEEDEFGDDAFLMDVDLDAITAAAEGTNNEPASKNIHVNTNTNASIATTNPVVKRRKVSPTNHFNNSNVDTSEEALQKTLSSVFGYNKFRDGQVNAIQHALNSENNGENDVAVFWATGSGKSLCYQLPAYHTKTITLVVSPLISLMEDQVHKLNGLSSSGKDVATFLGSGQMDRNKEQEALQGKYLIVYLTPEKLLSGGFLQQLATLHTTKRQIGLVAVDESHCCSEWGHDFRPQYRLIGSGLRGPEAPLVLQQIPIMALTATALPRVQDDIIRTLDLKNPYIARLSFDRPNLIISVHRKDRKMAMASAMEPLLQTLIDVEKRHQQESTIIYAPTRNQVEEITSFLKQRLESLARPEIQVEGYHAGLTPAERSRAHTNFLTGKTTVICATVAFGMGIDKPDTRRVVHFGAPSSVEAYYQQIGRAGRDGLQASVEMYISEADFDRYKGDFYMGGLTGSAKDAALASVDALKAYALDMSKCRRRALLDFFSETPTFQRCGTCDTCTKLRTLDSNDLERDFPASRVVLKAIQALDQPSTSTIMSVIGGKSVESYRYKRGIVESTLKDTIRALKDEPGKKMSQAGYQDLISPLMQRGFLTESSKSSDVRGFKRTWTTYSITVKGVQVLRDQSLPIVLPVPASVLEAEKIERARREAVVQKLKEAGVEVNKLPKEEVEAGDGTVIRAYSKWHSYLENMRRNGKTDRVSHLDELLTSIEAWRAEAAIKHRMAPGAVLAEHTVLGICYTVATMPKGVKMEESDLIAAGVRTKEIASLRQSISDWVEKHQKDAMDGSDGSAQNGNDDVSMELTPGQLVKGKRPWEFAVYKAIKKTGLASWESSYIRFSKGESPTTIAMSPANGRPIQVKTVCGHVMTALLHGKEVDLSRLATFMPPPTAREWNQLQEAEISVGMDVCGNPLNSGVGGDKFTKTDLLSPIMGSAFTETPYNERDEEEKAKFSLWCDRLEWYMTLRRLGIEPTFKAQ